MAAENVVTPCPGGAVTTAAGTGYHNIFGCLPPPFLLAHPDARAVRHETRRLRYGGVGVGGNRG